MGPSENNGRYAGFTLVEMSIVLVIIGLIVGGVLAGRYLIKASELQSIITDVQRYVTAVNTFRTKYNELPGDMIDATNIWGTDPNTCPDTCGSSCNTAPQIATCNGNGNGLIENDGVGMVTPQDFENFRAWQQLANAGLIQGAYSGVNGVLSFADNEPGQNVPATRIPNGGFEWTAFGPNGVNISPSTYNAQFYTQYLLLGSSQQSAQGPISSADLQHALLTPSDAQAIDLKIDDGIPETGTVLANSAPSWGGNCTPMWSDNGSYNTIYGTPACTLLFQVKSW